MQDPRRGLSWQPDQQSLKSSQILRAAGHSEACAVIITRSHTNTKSFCRRACLCFISHTVKQLEAVVSHLMVGV